MIGTHSSKLEEQIEKVLEANSICSFATVEGSKPKVRYMALFHEGLTIYLATNRKTDKVDEVRDNPNVHILVGFDGKASSDILQIQATAAISNDNALREKLWTDDMAKWFDGPHDPNYVVLEITPSYMEYSSKGSEPQIWKG
ncbi:pyridoxamine 5'-phosphate oxidase family protein [Paenibacillus sp. GCM10023248]|uniref:pyridoxamine 5'-phosphate oxidase family protein n=1 Tax=Bacillales TaxID=1385 RepID=UPI002379F297|nr:MULTISPECIES: pyridoxamine 5'-phosphate oxidase family protein [Bacillales]MDD9266463.1 pyridoxamine 5'-phosphate oxidase family protein [Paenibacillus sp. MAHUQ-63]MDR6878588.1 general stress protein 26 [Bacillus sp. 3255]